MTFFRAREPIMKSGLMRNVWRALLTRKRNRCTPLYLPRKFKIGIAVPPSNDIDVFSQDLGFIAIVEEGSLIGFNVAIGGGMGMTHGDTATYPQLSKVIGFCKPEQLYDVAEKPLRFSAITETVPSERMPDSSTLLTVSGWKT